MTGKAGDALPQAVFRHSDKLFFSTSLPTNFVIRATILWKVASAAKAIVPGADA